MELEDQKPYRFEQHHPSIMGKLLNRVHEHAHTQHIPDPLKIALENLPHIQKKFETFDASFREKYLNNLNEHLDISKDNTTQTVLNTGWMYLWLQDFPYHALDVLLHGYYKVPISTAEKDEEATLKQSIKAITKSAPLPKRKHIFNFIMAQTHDYTRLYVRLYGQFLKHQEIFHKNSQSQESPLSFIDWAMTSPKFMTTLFEFTAMMIVPDDFLRSRL